MDRTGCPRRHIHCKRSSTGWSRAAPVRPRVIAQQVDRVAAQTLQFPLVRCARQLARSRNAEAGLIALIDYVLVEAHDLTP